MRFLSLFSGIEAASVAWKPIGWECVGVAEIDKAPCALLKHYYPNVPNLGNVTDITEQQIKDLGHIDLVVMGFPCQDLSVAGKRKGLKNADGSITRSGLFFTAMQIVGWTKARWTVGENVPGLFSSDEGRDFATVVGELAGTEFDVPANGWRTTGVALGPHGLVEWTVLDAQYFGVAQRRRRVFFVRDTGDWRSRPPVLFERHSLQGHPAPSREARQRPAPTLSARTKGGGGLGTDFDLDGGLICAGTGQAGTEFRRNLAPTLNCNHEQPYIAHAGLAPALTHNPYGDNESREGLLIAHTLKAEGFDASEDGTGRGTPIVPVAFAENSRAEVRLEGGDGSIVGALNGGGGKPGQGTPCIAFKAGQGSAAGSLGIGKEVSPTLGAADSGSNRTPTVAYRTSGNCGVMEQGDKTACLNTATDPNANIVRTGMAVRRLTPRECERLQGFPDGYTLVPYNGKPKADGPRYKELGNSFAVPVVVWIGKRIARVEGLKNAS